MLITDYIKSKFQSFGITMSEADLLDIWTGTDANISDENKTEVETAIAGFIPQLLLRPKSISEGGYSISFDTQSIKDYYAFLCKKYDLENSIGSSISDASDIW